MAFPVEFAQDCLDKMFVPRFGSADKIIIAELQLCGEGFPRRGQFVAISLGTLALGLSNLLHFLTVFVEAGEKERILTETSPGSRDDIGNHFFVRMTQMRMAIDIINGSREVKALAHPAFTLAKASRVGNVERGGLGFTLVKRGRSHNMASCGFG